MAQFAGNQNSLNIVAFSTGQFMDVWFDDGLKAVRAQIFDANGVKIGSEFSVSSRPVSDGHPSGSLAGNDHVVMSWWDVNWGQIYSRVLDATGSKISSEILVGPAGTQGFPVSTAIGSGNVLVAWVGNDASNYGIFGQIVGTSGDPVGSSFRINAGETGAQFAPVSAPAENSGALVGFYAASGPYLALDTRLVSSSGVLIAGDYVYTSPNSTTRFDSGIGDLNKYVMESPNSSSTNGLIFNINGTALSVTDDDSTQAQSEVWAVVGLRANRRKQPGPAIC